MWTSQRRTSPSRSGMAKWVAFVRCLFCLPCMPWFQLCTSWKSSYFKIEPWLERKPYFHCFSDRHTRKACVSGLCVSYTHMGILSECSPGKFLSVILKPDWKWFSQTQRKLCRNLTMDVLHCFAFAPFVSAVCVV